MNSESDSEREERFREQAEIIRLLMPFLPTPTMQGEGRLTIVHLVPATQDIGVIERARTALAARDITVHSLHLAAGPNSSSEKGLHYLDPTSDIRWAFRIVKDELMITHDHAELSKWRLAVVGVDGDEQYACQPHTVGQPGASYRVPLDKLNGDIALTLVGI